ncbi:hypothetical protein [Saccharopolyspora sp. CA-218241]|uniref:hypothetical protein n=1 Tax=Saccharopolyspora sp. CA-218241 TaxID=3240027 RepID=UPI003D9A0180
MTTPAAPPPPPVPGGAGQTVAVNQDNVLEARKIILAATHEAEERLGGLQWSLAIDPPAKDDISVAAATEWNRNLLTNPDSHYNRLMQYVLNVKQLAVQMEDAAKQYGYTEEEIRASFDDVNRGAE